MPKREGNKKKTLKIALKVRNRRHCSSNPLPPGCAPSTITLLQNRQAEVCSDFPHKTPTFGRSPNLEWAGLGEILETAPTVRAAQLPLCGLLLPSAQSLCDQLLGIRKNMASGIRILFYVSLATSQLCDLGHISSH